MKTVLSLLLLTMAGVSVVNARHEPTTAAMDTTEISTTEKDSAGTSRGALKRRMGMTTGLTTAASKRYANQPRTRRMGMSAGSDETSSMSSDSSETSAS
ncbi:hypothetical protein H0X06_07265 [Candidatus Dependentiae bacterium]|nr:hypothetical protein [Candidatus Dependentiae bacterium]